MSGFWGGGDLRYFRCIQLKAGWLGFVFRDGQRFLSIPQRPDRLWGLFQGCCGVLSPEIQRPEREAHLHLVSRATVAELYPRSLIVLESTGQVHLSCYLRYTRPRGRSSSPGGVKNFLFSRSSRPALRSTQPPIQWVPRALSPGVKR
jgi:hypothetical protein